MSMERSLPRPEDEMPEQRIFTLAESVMTLAKETYPPNDGTTEAIQTTLELMAKYAEEAGRQSPNHVASFHSAALKYYTTHIPDRAYYYSPLLAAYSQLFNDVPQVPGE